MGSVIDDVFSSTRLSFEVQKGLDIALALDKLIPGDFTSKIEFSVLTMEIKNWEKAKEWTQKGLQIRFDNTLMKTHLEIASIPERK